MVYFLQYSLCDWNLLFTYSVHNVYDNHPWKGWSIWQLQWKCYFPCLVGKKVLQILALKAIRHFLLVLWRIKKNIVLESKQINCWNCITCITTISVLILYSLIRSEFDSEALKTFRSFSLWKMHIFNKKKFWQEFVMVNRFVVISAS